MVRISLNLVWPQKLRAPTPQKHNPKTFCRVFGWMHCRTERDTFNGQTNDCKNSTKKLHFLPILNYHYPWIVWHLFIACSSSQRENPAVDLSGHLMWATMENDGNMTASRRTRRCGPQLVESSSIRLFLHMIAVDFADIFRRNSHERALSLITFNLKKCCRQCCSFATKNSRVTRRKTLFTFGKILGINGLLALIYLF